VFVFVFLSKFCVVSPEVHDGLEVVRVFNDRLDVIICLVPCVEVFKPAGNFLVENKWLLLEVLTKLKKTHLGFF
jgi:hypothetical protein